MALTYDYLPADDQDDTVAEAVLGRESEHHNYELNRLNYEQILSDLADEGLPATWPAELVKYRGVFGEDLAAQLLDDPTSYALVTRLQFRDRIKLLLATTKTEQAKVESITKVLKTRLSKAKLDAAVSRVKAKRTPT
jgi:hypothetical protein